MIPQTFLTEIIDPGLAALAQLGGPPPTREVRRFLLAIAMQESGPALEARYQASPGSNPGPARGWWQFEQGGGVRGVLSHALSAAHARKVCARFSVQPADGAVWRAMEGHDQLAVCFARLLVLTDPKAVPASEPDGWSYYLRTWRPGRPHPETWPANWAMAEAAVAAITVWGISTNHPC